MNAIRAWIGRNKAHISNRVKLKSKLKLLLAIAFIYTLQIEKRYDDPSEILAALAKLIGTLLGPGPGYQCKHFMLAFPWGCCFRTD